MWGKIIQIVLKIAKTTQKVKKAKSFLNLSRKFGALQGKVVKKSKSFLKTKTINKINSNSMVKRIKNSEKYNKIMEQLLKQEQDFLNKTKKLDFVWKQFNRIKNLEGKEFILAQDKWLKQQEKIEEEYEKSSERVLKKIKSDEKNSNRYSFLRSWIRDDKNKKSFNEFFGEGGDESESVVIGLTSSWIKWGIYEPIPYLKGFGNLTLQLRRRNTKTGETISSSKNPSLIYKWGIGQKQPPVPYFVWRDMVLSDAGGAGKSFWNGYWKGAKNLQITRKEFYKQNTKKVKENDKILNRRIRKPKGAK